MDAERLFALSAAGMSVERTRVEVAAMNLANTNTIATDGIAYQPLRVVARTSGISFAEHVEGGLGAVDWSGIPESVVEPTLAPPRIVHDPAHPFANKSGDVAYPGVDPATEMLTLMSALRAYEANVAALNISRLLAMKTLDIGGGST